jgi:hypothetical protein
MNERAIIQGRTVRRLVVGWLLVLLLGLIITEVRLSHGELTSSRHGPRYWIRDR